MIHKNALVAFLVLASASNDVAGFAPIGQQQNSGSRSAPFNSGAVVPSSGSSTALAAGPDVINQIAALAAGAAAVMGTIKFSDKEGDSSVASVLDKKKKEKSSSSSTTTTTTTTSTATKATKAPKEESKKVVKDVEFTTPAVKRQKEKAAAAKPAPAPAPEPVAAAPAPAPPVPAPAPVSPPPAPKPAQKDISQIRNEVASTIDSRKEMQKRLDDAKAARSVAPVEEVVETAVEEEVPEPEAEEAEEETSAESGANGRKRRFVGKLIKKTVMPWKKWSNL